METVCNSTESIIYLNLKENNASYFFSLLFYSQDPFSYNSNYA